jgi:acetyl-CoA carboxylase biotin carboxylase subunit
MPLFDKVLVANRGEIAVRIIRALRELDIRSVAVFSDADRGALHVRMADEAVHIGPSPSSESYLRIERILDAARQRGASAIHPGYGFLSENAAFAQACQDAGIVFIGPSPDAIRRLGSKTAARKLAKAANAPVVPGTEEPLNDLDRARAVARQLGYPVLLKAAHGGGGKGMRRVDSEDELESAIRSASGEAERSFHSSEVYLEKVVIDPRHIEIQLLGDHHGNLVHLGERECSLQRRHQKVIEECPSPLMSEYPELRQAMGEAAVRVAREAGYYNAGTAEFLVDADRNFYFLEMNTRLQVEHPVTELVTGLDLVHLQLRIAAGEPLPFTQDQITWRGSALECRIYAEDPDENFFPSPGKILQLREPAGPGIRLDSGVYPGWTVPLDYDPMLAKLIAWSPDRATSIRRMRRAVEEYAITGIRTNLAFFGEILTDAAFGRGELHTGFIQEFLARRAPRGEVDPELAAVAELVARTAARPAPQPRTDSAPSRWTMEGRGSLLR